MASYYQFFRKAQDLRKRKLSGSGCGHSPSGLDHVTLDDALFDAVTLAQEAVVHAASWSLKMDMSPFMRDLDDLADRLNGICFSAAFENWRDAINGTYSLLDALASIGWSATLDKSDSRRVDAGDRLWTAATGMHSFDIRKSHVTFPFSFYAMSVISGINGITADLAIKSLESEGVVQASNASSLALSFVHSYANSLSSYRGDACAEI